VDRHFSLFTNKPLDLPPRPQFHGSVKERLALAWNMEWWKTNRKWETQRKLVKLI
jgi:hypothetical protein